MDDITEQLSQLIQPLYLVGGSVRDRIIGRSTLDLDYATPLLPSEVHKIVQNAGIKPNLVGKKFGTIGFKIGEHAIQITTFRGEDYPENSRKPKVRYVTELVEDLKRRDFTINALAAKDKDVYDPLDGLADIQNKIIRAVGSPAERFREDPLRMLRGFRFASELGFSIENNTLRAIDDEALKILLVSKERISEELDKIMLGDYFVDVLTEFRNTLIFKYLLPELYTGSPIVKGSHASLDNMIAKNSDYKLAQRWSYVFDTAFADLKQEHDPYFEAELLGHIAKYYHWSKEKNALIREYLLNK